MHPLSLPQEGPFFHPCCSGHQFCSRLGSLSRSRAAWANLTRFQHATPLSASRAQQQWPEAEELQTKLPRLVILTALLCILPAVSRHRLGKPSAVHLVHPHRLKHASGQRNIQHALPRVTPSQPPPHCLLPLAYKPPAAVRQWAGIFHAFAEKRKWTGDFGWSVNVLEKD